MGNQITLSKIKKQSDEPGVLFTSRTKTGHKLVKQRTDTGFSKKMYLNRTMPGMMTFRISFYEYLFIGVGYIDI